ncbi:MAG: DciA family protein [Pseudomonadota bacterium]
MKFTLKSRYVTSENATSLTPVKDILKKTSQIASILEDIHFQNFVTKKLQQMVPFEMQDQFKVIGIRGETLLLEVNSAVWISYFRLSESLILQKLAKLTESKIATLHKLKIVTRQQVVPRKLAGLARPGNANIEMIKNSAVDLKDDRLRNAMQKLACSLGQNKPRVF